jgi:transcription antitermination factor NusG
MPMPDPGADRPPPPSGGEPRGERWFAVWTRSRHERAVFDQLTERGIEAFLPTVLRWSRWKDRRKQIDWPLFPGYCFARIESSGRLAVLKCANSALPYDPCPMLKAGTKVEVVHGPLKGVVGKLQRKGPHMRLVLSVDLIGRGVSVQVDAADVREI